MAMLPGATSRVQIDSTHLLLMSKCLVLQLGQERLARMLGNINAMFLMVYRLSRLHEQGKMSHAQASMVKAWTTLRGESPQGCCGTVCKATLRALFGSLL